MSGFLKSLLYREISPFLHDLMPIGSMLLHGAFFCFFILSATFVICWGREKLLARMEMRPSGSLKSLFCHGCVGLLKRPSVPDRAQKTLFIAAPLFAFVFSLFFFFFMPIGFSSGLPFDFSMLYFLFTASCGVYAFIVGGWSGSSRFSFFGAVRLIAQSLACQPVLAVVVVTVLMTAGGSDLQTVMRSQKNLWFVVPHFPLFVLYLLSSAMLLAQAPFGSPKSDRELAGGVFSEYSGALYVLFSVSENILLLLCSTVGSILFLGGSMPLFGMDFPELWLAIKTVSLVLVLTLVKETFPVWKTSRIVNISFKTYLPFALIWMLATADVLYLAQGGGGMNLKKKLHSFFFPDIWRSLSVSLRYAAGIGAMQKVKPLPRTVSRYPVVDHSLCSGCKLCVKVCPAAALQVRTVFQESEKAAVTFSHLPDRCVSCGLCVEACPENALVLKGK